ncbi:MAG: transcriptional regulator, MarR family [Pseudonocardiales bacterium]|jgi:DNA-binding MarR family transcriptional regulator|nr:transcriptional regulator, MarR family [Pseudonocardiales bacterium]
MPVSVAPTAVGGPPLEDVAAVADTFVGLMRSFNRVRAKFLAAAEHDIEWSGHVVLRVLATDGPMRLSALADRLESDPSTISRQVATLVKHGLLERRADPADGRACLLVLTAAADEVLREHNDIRLHHFQKMLSSWSDRDLRRFTALLQRFTDDFENANTNWISEPAASRSPEGNH